MSANEDQLALHAFTYHSFNGCSLSGCFVQNSLNVDIAITLIWRKVINY